MRENMGLLKKRIKQLQERISNDRIIRKRNGEYICKFCRNHPDDCFCNDYAKLELKGINFAIKQLN